jgi:hypothetical protein
MRGLSGSVEVNAGNDGSQAVRPLRGRWAYDSPTTVLEATSGRFKVLAIKTRAGLHIVP